jgi:fluoride exporter
VKLLYLCTFGLLGVTARYGIGAAVQRVLPSAVPLATFSINIVGAFLIGVVYVLGIERAALSEPLRIGIAAGFLGGFTTFSAYCLEGARFLEEGQFGTALLYYVGSPTIGLVATFLGLIFARAVISGVS